LTLHELLCQPARNSADNDGCDPAHLWVFHGSISSKAHPGLSSRSIDYLSPGTIGP
jgi:hypothetical protein